MDFIDPGMVIIALGAVGGFVGLVVHDCRRLNKAAEPLNRLLDMDKRPRTWYNKTS